MSKRKLPRRRNNKIADIQTEEASCDGKNFIRLVLFFAKLTRTISNCRSFHSAEKKVMGDQIFIKSIASSKRRFWRMNFLVITSTLLLFRFIVPWTSGPASKYIQCEKNAPRCIHDQFSTVEYWRSQVDRKSSLNSTLHDFEGLIKIYRAILQMTLKNMYKNRQLPLRWRLRRRPGFMKVLLPNGKKKKWSKNQRATFSFARFRPFPTNVVLEGIVSFFFVSIMTLLRRD